MSTSSQPDADALPAGAGKATSSYGRFGQADVVAALVLAAIVAGPVLGRFFTAPAFQTWCTMFVAIVLQAVPFLVLGVVLAALVSEFLTEPLLKRVLPRHPLAAVPAAGLAGMALPGCECASVPIAASLLRNGAVPAAAFTFLLAGPAINPVVLVATSMAFPGRPEFVLARFAASLLASLVVGWLWALRGHTVPLRMSERHGGHHHAGEAGGTDGGGWPRVRTFVAEARHEFVHTGGFLIVGAGIAASVNTFLPRDVLTTLGSHQILSVLVMAGFAFVVAMCSEADAFVAASLTAFSDVARLAFLVVGPAVDVKLVTLHAGHFGRRFAVVFAPVVFLVAVGSAALVGGLLL